MKRWLLWGAAALIALAVSREQRTDAGNLQPVALLQLYRQGTTLVIETDTGDEGRGETLSLAFENLKQTTPGVIFLETADFLLVTADAVRYLPELTDILRPGTEVLLISQTVDAESAAKYLDCHRTGITLQKHRFEGAKLTNLSMCEGRYALGK